MTHNVMFWANVTAYIERLVSGDYGREKAITAATLKYHVSKLEILEHCNIDTSETH